MTEDTGNKFFVARILFYYQLVIDRCSIAEVGGKMSNIPGDLKYTKDDEWIRVEGEEATVGITDYAQDSLSDIVYLELPEVGDSFGEGDTFGVVESVKAAADLLMPLSGKITAVNDSLIDAPETVNSDPYGDAWMIRFKMSDTAQLDTLMDAAAYTQYLADRD
jgi:glycine cleavage system H protein